MKVSSIQPAVLAIRLGDAEEHAMIGPIEDALAAARVKRDRGVKGCVCSRRHVGVFGTMYREDKVVTYLLRQVMLGGTEEAIEITAAQLRLNPKEKSRLCELVQALNLQNP